MPDADAKPESKKDESTSFERSKVGHFIQTYSGFLSTFVLSAAGLIATSVWQYRQSGIAQQQADAQQKIAQTQADNNWKISRAEILAKNLGVLGSQGPNTVDQRYGVLLSLARGNILDPELAVSYALELGRENPTYMSSVLSNTDQKNYTQLLQAFKLTCVQKFGIAKEVSACANDKLSDRSDAIAQLISDELEAANAQNKSGPIELMRDERVVQANLSKFAWLFEPYITDLYNRRMTTDITRFEAQSVGAHLIASLILATSRTGEFVAADEAARLDAVQAEHRKFINGYFFGPSCGPECKNKLIDFMLSLYGESEGSFDDTIKKLLLGTRAQSGAAIGQLHSRLLWCQIDPDDEAQLRDHVLIPALSAAIAAPATDKAITGDIAGLVALTPDPIDPKANPAWSATLEALRKHSNELYEKSFVNRRALAKHERDSPPPALKSVTFCNAAPQVVVPQHHASE